jgi:uracil-DNA glycosylase family 4
VSDFKLYILKEEPAPSFAAACEQCELSKQRKRVIWGEGNPNAPIFVLLDNPGSREDREGQSFLCGTRETLQLGMKQAGLGIDRVYVSYLLKCRPIRAYNKPLAREACSSHLNIQLTEKKPLILLGLGNTVVQTLFPNQEAEVKNYRGKWHVFKDIATAFSYHPLAVRRRPALMKYFVEDLKFIVDKVNMKS